MTKNILISALAALFLPLLKSWGVDLTIEQFAALFVVVQAITHVASSAFETYVDPILRAKIAAAQAASRPRS